MGDLFGSTTAEMAAHTAATSLYKARNCEHRRSGLVLVEHGGPGTLIPGVREEVLIPLHTDPTLFVP